ncbi:MAG: DNA repair protein RecO [Minisyncoccia bacterium]
MEEYISEAVVLGYRPRKENDRTVDLFTKNYGRLEAKVIGGRKILSKLAPHLDIFNLVTVRLVEKNNLTLTDVLTDERFKKERSGTHFYPAAFRIINIIRALVPKAEPDRHLWHALTRNLRESDGDIRQILKIFGYDPAHAACDNCGRAPVAAFRAKDQSFFCRECGFKTRADELTYF